MSDITLLFVLTLLVFVSGSFLTSGWDRYLASRHNKRQTRKMAH
jgi:hypothetical protein